MAGMTKHPPRPTEADRASRLFRMLNEGGGCSANSCPSNFAGGNNNFCNDVQRECLACCLPPFPHCWRHSVSLTHTPSCCGDSLCLCYALLFCGCLCHYFLLLLAAALCCCRWSAVGCGGCPQGTYTVTATHKMFFVVTSQDPNTNGKNCANICCQAANGNPACCWCKCAVCSRAVNLAPTRTVASLTASHAQWVHFLSISQRGGLSVLHRVRPRPLPGRLVRHCTPAQRQAHDCYGSDNLQRCSTVSACASLSKRVVITSTCYVAGCCSVARLSREPSLALHSSSVSVPPLTPVHCTTSS